MKTTVINHRTKTITTYQITNAVVESAKEMLSMFTSDNKAVSLGFERLEKLSKKKRQTLEVSFMREGLGQSEVKMFLETMTEQEYREFKKSK